VATVIIPGAATLFLVALPFVDRAETRSWKRRVPVLSMVGLGMAGVVVLTALAVTEDAANEHITEGLEVAEQEGERTRELALEGVLPEGGTAVWQNDPQYAAITLFRENCATCHSLDEAVLIGGKEAPDLTNFSSRAWLIGAIREPQSPRYFGGSKEHDEMEAYSAEDLPDDQLAAVVEYLMQLRAADGAAEGLKVDAALAAKGKTLWDDELECNACHEVEKGAGGGAPNFYQRGSLAWIERVIKNPAGPDLYEDGAQMPAYEKKLSKESIASLAKLVHLQGLDAAPAP
jgi:ubiquinol-cytochrome c reductase cytochrome b subunit